MAVIEAMMGLVLKGGFGLAGAIVESSSSGGPSVTKSGFGTGVGAGYEFRASESLFINLRFDLGVGVLEHRSLRFPF